MNTLQSNILLVEDDSNDVLLLERALKKAHLRNPLKVVRDGEQATKYLAGEGSFADRTRFPFPSLMLLDLKLPCKSGHEVLAWVREQKNFIKRLPVVVLTSSKHLMDINRAYDLGANSYLIKAGDFGSLFYIMQNVERYWLQLNERPELQLPL